jgi:hypothetical protein
MPETITVTKEAVAEPIAFFQQRYLEKMVFGHKY